MALPPWTVELLRRGVQDLARQVTDPETTQALRQQASKMVEELPKVARDKVDAFLKQAEAASSAVREGQTTTEPWSMAPANRDAGPWVNATGQLLHERGSGIRVPDRVIQAGLRWWSHDQVMTQSQRHEITQAIATVMSEATGEPVEFAITTSMASAVAWVATLGRRGRQLWVPRCCAVPLALDVPPGPGDAPSQSRVLADQLRSMGGQVREFGSVAGPTLADYQSVAESMSGRRGGSPRLTNASHQNASEPALVVRLARASCETQSQAMPDGRLRQIVVLPEGRWLPSNAAGHDGLPVATELLQKGIDAVVMRGGVFTATPNCGIILAKPAVMRLLESSPAGPIATAPPAMLAMASAAAQWPSDAKLPIDELVSGSESNLRDRAERLATQCSGIAAITSVRVTDDDAHLHSGGTPIASRQVRLTTQRHSMDDWIQQLHQASPALVGRRDGLELVLDLRFVESDQQSHIAAVIAQSLE